MDSSDWKRTIGTIAPALATALGGPLAGTAVGLIADKLLGNPNGTKDDIQKFVEAGMSPEALANLKKIDNDFAIQMEGLGVQLEKINADDRNSAREREVKTGDYTPKILAGLIVGCFLYAQYYLLHNIIPQEQKDIVMYLLGVLNTALGMVLSYYFGSSASSKHKTDSMAAALKNK